MCSFCHVYVKVVKGQITSATIDLLEHSQLARSFVNCSSNMTISYSYWTLIQAIFPQAILIRS